MRINTDLGDITVDEYYKGAKFITNKGKVSVYSKSEYSTGYITEIISDDGNVSVNNKANQLIVTTTGRAEVKVVFESIPTGIENATNDIINKVSVAEKGRADVYFPSVILTPFRFKATGRISGYISSLPIVTSEQEQYYPTDATVAEIQTSASYEFLGNITFKSA